VGRRSLSEPAELTADVVLAPYATTLATVVQVAGSRWTIERAFAEAQGAVGLAHDEVRSWTGWYRQSTLARWAYALLTGLRAVQLPTEEAPKKTLSPPTPSSLAAFKAARGLLCH
jgi:SRSO17 transposase